MKTLFDSQRLTLEESMSMTADTLNAFGQGYDDWLFAWSGGKDSTCCLTLALHLIESGLVQAPKSITVLYADTRQEILPLAFAASEIIEALRDRNIDVRTVMAPIDQRMWVYILGRGVPPPNNNTLRYCTRQIKIEPMAEQVKRVADERGRKVLCITGVRLGESAARDSRIALACTTNGAECGQGHFHQSLKGGYADTLAPLVHWRVCHVWAWLNNYAPDYRFGEWPTRVIAEAYGGQGGNEEQDINARTGCVCCPLASRDTALDAVIANPSWAYLAPLKEIRDLYRWLREPENRLRKPGGERRKDGSLVANQQRMGPITFSARLEGLSRLIDIQNRVNESAVRLGRPKVDHLNAEEESRIRELVAAGTWPNGWDGSEPTADTILPTHYADGSIMHHLFGDFD
jgi:DNA sulfur modification protein DndC